MRHAILALPLTVAIASSTFVPAQLVLGNCTIKTAIGADGEALLELEPSCAFNTHIQGVDQTLASMGADLETLKRQVAALMSNTYLLNDLFDGSSVNTANWVNTAGYTVSGGELVGIAGGKSFMSQQSFSAPITVEARMMADSTQCLMMQVFPASDARHSGFNYCGFCWGTSAFSGREVLYIPSVNTASSLLSSTAGTTAGVYHTVRVTVDTAGAAVLYINAGNGWIEAMRSTAAHGTFTSGSIGFNDGCTGFKVDYVRVLAGVHVPTLG